MIGCHTGFSHTEEVMLTPQQCAPLPYSSPAALAFQPALCPAYTLTRIATAAKRCAAVAADIADVSQSASTREDLQNAELLPRILGEAQNLRHHPQVSVPDFETGANLPLSGYSLCRSALMGYIAIPGHKWGLLRASSVVDALQSDSRRCEAEHAPLRVALLLSGGVDSSLALRLLQAAGHEVTAFYLQVRAFPTLMGLLTMGCICVCTVINIFAAEYSQPWCNITLLPNLAAQLPHCTVHGNMVECPSCTLSCCVSGQIWFQEDFRNSWGACPWEDDLAICQEVRSRCLLWLSASDKISHTAATYVNST